MKGVWAIINLNACNVPYEFIFQVKLSKLKTVLILRLESNLTFPSFKVKSSVNVTS